MAAALTTAFIIAFNVGPARAGDRVLVQSTTSTKNAGLYKHLAPLIKADTGLVLSVVAVGTGQAIRNAQRCDGDVLLVHARAAEEAFVAAGYGIKRHNLMYNDFVIVGPAADPAGVAGMKAPAQALTAIARKRALFASRGDNSGTHTKERALWAEAGVKPQDASGRWYRETGSGMGATLNIAVGMGAYTLSDRATWLSFKNKRGFKVLVEGDAALFNQYGVIAVNPKACANVRAAHATKLISWLLSKRGQAAIAAHKVDGQQLFFPNAQGQ
ncbi:MAG: substrate-binding domain-containing protein [Pseudomonadota bacterium]